MIKGKALLGRSIVGQNDGKVLGAVKDLVFDHDTDEVLSLLIADKDLFGLIDAVIVPWRFVRNFRGDVILVESAASLMKMHQDPRTRDLSNRETVLSGTRVLSSDGRELGTLADMCIDEITGRVVGYEVSGGFFSDTLRGKKFVPAPPGLAVGPHAAIARTEAEEVITGQSNFERLPLPPREHSPMDPPTPVSNNVSSSSQQTLGTTAGVGTTYIGSRPTGAVSDLNTPVTRPVTDHDEEVAVVEPGRRREL